MPKSDIPLPTDAELEILNILWERGHCTVREVHDVLNERKPTGYTTVLKQMQIMAEKGIVRRDESQRAHVYRPRLVQEQTQRHLLGDLLNRAFNGSAMKMVMQALTTEKASAEELTQLRTLLDKFERES